MSTFIDKCCFKQFEIKLYKWNENIDSEEKETKHLSHKIHLINTVYESRKKILILRKLSYHRLLWKKNKWNIDL